MIINKILWYVASILLIGSGIYYTFKLHFVQFDFKGMLNSFKKSNNYEKGVSPLETLTLSLAARIGVGSLAGIAYGIYKGGIGVIFWIWLSALITIPNSLVESALAVKFHEKDGVFYKGGPAYYISKGLQYKRMALLYAIIISICYLGGFLAIQANTITISLRNYFNVPIIVSSILIAMISFIIIYKGLKGITSFTAKLVPIMGLSYLLICLIVIFKNIYSLPNALLNILQSAFQFKTIGFGILSSVIIGIERGIFSSESGIGTGACASGTSSENNPIKQGMIQMFGVYFTSFIICTATALIIILADIPLNSFHDINGIEIVQVALNTSFGNIGNIVLTLLIITFAFSTIISGYYYSESNIKYIFKNISNRQLLIVKFMVIIVIFYGSFAKPSSLWNLVDTGVALLAIINIISLLLLRKDVFMLYNDYLRKIR